MTRPDRDGTFCLEGADIHYAIFGQGPPLVLLHGNSEDMRYFAPQIEAFRRGFTVIAVDSRGHGKSAFGPHKLGLALMARDVSALLKRLHVGPCHVLGFSDGGNIALTLALEDASLCRSLILVGANLFPSGMKAPVWLAVVLDYALHALLSPLSASARRKRQILGLMAREPHIRPEALHALALPALVIAGQRDMIKEAHTRAIARALPGGRLCILPGGDHFVSSKLPEAFNRVVREFLAGL